MARASASEMDTEAQHPQDPAYGVAVEFEIAGNIWGIASPPEDWVPIQAGKAMRGPLMLDENYDSSHAPNRKEFRPEMRGLLQFLFEER